MSYSFSIRAPSIALAVAAVASKFDEVVANQPVHANDRDQAVAAASAMIGICSEPAEGQELSVSVNGWLQWRSGDGVIEAYDFSGASLSVSASTVPKAE